MFIHHLGDSPSLPSATFVLGFSGQKKLHQAWFLPSLACRRMAHLISLLSPCCWTYARVYQPFSLLLGMRQGLLALHSALLTYARVYQPSSQTCYPCQGLLARLAHLLSSLGFTSQTCAFAILARVYQLDQRTCYPCQGLLVEMALGFLHWTGAWCNALGLSLEMLAW